MSAISAQVEQGEFCGTLLRALNDLGRMGTLGGPQEQMEVLRHQHPPEQAEVLLLAKPVESLDKVEPETVRVERTGAAVIAGGRKMRVMQAIVMALAEHHNILQP